MPEGHLVKVVAVSLDTARLTLYLEDGSTTSVPQGDPRLRRIVEQCIPEIRAQGFALVDLAGENGFRAYEEKSSGLVRFFRVAKRKLASLFGKKDLEPVPPVPPVSLEVPKPVPLVPPPPDDPSGKDERDRKAVDEILRNAVPASHPRFGGDLGAEDTLVAVVGKPGEQSLVPDVQALEAQVDRAVQSGIKGMQEFLRRLGEVAKERGHTVRELMEFMRRGDLPVADDGSIVIYKVLQQNPTRPGRYVDVHSRLVDQGIGSVVCMDESLVDRDRTTECSNGLHVARRRYLGSFHGEVCVIAKVKPEDVIAVPHGEPDKMRVCAYHVLFELDQDSYDKIRRNLPFTDNPAARRLLGRAISGDHPPPVEMVVIGGPKGTNLRIIPLVKTAGPVEPRKETTAMLETEVLPDDPKTGAPAVSPRSVLKAMEETPAAPAPTTPPKEPEPSQGPPVTAPAATPMTTPEKASEPPKRETAEIVALPSRKDKALAIYAEMIAHPPGSKERAQAAWRLKGYKKASKISWGMLGITDDMLAKVTAELNSKE